MEGYTPKSSMLIGFPWFSLTSHPFGGTPIVGNAQWCVFCSSEFWTVPFFRMTWPPNGVFSTCQVLLAWVMEFHISLNMTGPRNHCRPELCRFLWQRQPHLPLSEKAWENWPSTTHYNPNFECHHNPHRAGKLLRRFLVSLAAFLQLIWAKTQIYWFCNDLTIWVCLKIVYPYTQWFCWSLSLLNGYFIGNIPYFQTNPYPSTIRSAPKQRAVRKVATIARDTDVIAS